MKLARLGCLAIFLSTCSTVAVSEELSVVGTGDGVTVLQALGAAFEAENPGTQIFVPPSIHTSGAVRAVTNGSHFLGRVARPLKPEEKAIGILTTPIFRQPAAFFVHPSTGISALTAKQLVDIYSGTVDNWQEVGGSDMPIRVVRREEVDSTLAVLRETLPGWKDITFKIRSKIAVTTQDAFDTVATVPRTIGFGPYSDDLERVVKVIRIDGLHPTDDGYPSAVTLSLIHREATVTPLARRFIDFVFTPAAQQITRSVGAVPIPKRETISLLRPRSP